MKEEQINHTPTLDEINDMFDSYQKELILSESHLRLKVEFSTENMDDIFDLLEGSYEIETTKTTH